MSQKGIYTITHIIGMREANEENHDGKLTERISAASVPWGEDFSQLLQHCGQWPEHKEEFGLISRSCTSSKKLQCVKVMS